MFLLMTSTGWEEQSMGKHDCHLPDPGSGLPALEPAGVPLLLEGRSLIFFFLGWPSDISPPVASPSLADPPAIFLRWPACPWGMGVVERLCTADDPACFFTFFLRVDSLPLDSETVGDPDRLRLFTFLVMSAFLPVGVEEPFWVVPEGALSFSAFAFSSSSVFAFSSSSSSSSSSSLWHGS